MGARQKDLQAAPGGGLGLWTTDNVPDRQKLDYWAGAICDVYLRVECSAPSAAPFEGRMESIEAAGLKFTRMQSSSLVMRTASSPGGCKDVFYLVADRHAGWTLKQQGRVQQVRVGDACLIDARDPYQVSFHQGIALSAIELPLPWLRRHLRSADDHGSRIVSRDSGWGRVLSSLCIEISTDLGLAGKLHGTQLADQLGGLLTASLEPLECARAPAQALSLREQVGRLLEERLAEPGLAAADLAQALGVSVRTLHRGFAASGTTFAASLRERRIARAVALLQRPNLAHLTVAEIGARCGFHDPSHFSREFHRSQGMPPARWRLGSDQAG